MTMKGGTSLRRDGISKSRAAFSIAIQTVSDTHAAPLLPYSADCLPVTGALGDLIQHRQS
jgi:hypothetical protein